MKTLLLFTILGLTYMLSGCALISDLGYESPDGAYKGDCGPKIMNRATGKCMQRCDVVIDGHKITKQFTLHPRECAI